MQIIRYIFDLPFSQRTKTVCRNVILAPEGEGGIVRGTDDIGEMCQPNGEGIIFGVSLVRPDSFEHKLLLNIQVGAVEKRELFSE
jgi:hypothetical protein